MFIKLSGLNRVNNLFWVSFKYFFDYGWDCSLPLLY